VFVSEALRPVGIDFDADAMGRGEPGLPAAFEWRDQTLTIATVVRMWKGTKTDRGDVYVKRHYFDVELHDGRRATMYFERQAKPGQPRWWLYTIE
jgi:hypothetical protein